MTLGDGGGFELWRDPSPTSRPCAFCRQDVASDPAVLCNRCGTIYHPDCWKANNQRCAVYGCAPVSPPPPAAPPPPPPPRVRREPMPVPEPARFGSGLGRGWGFLGVIVLVNAIRIIAGSSTKQSSSPPEFRPPQIDYKRTIDTGNRGLSEQLLNVAQSSRRMGKFENALNVCNQVIKLNPNHAAAYHVRGEVRVDLGDLEGAVSDYTRAYQLDRTDLRAIYDRGCALYDLQKWEDCVKDFALTYQNLPSLRTPSQLRFCLARSRLGQRTAAEKDLATFLKERDIVDPWSRQLLSFAARRSDEGTLFAEAEGGPPEWRCQGYFYAGELRLLDGDPEQAKVYFARCQEVGSRADREWASAAARLRTLEKN